MERNQNKDNTKETFAYAIYMIAGSYFKKVECLSPMLESKLRIAYVDQKLDKQYNMEDKCIQYVEKVMMSKVPADLFDAEAKVKIGLIPGTDVYEMKFITKKYILFMKGNYAGKNTVIAHKVEKKA